MTEQEFHGYMIIGAVMGAVSLFAWCMERREDRKFRERDRELNSGLAVIISHFDRISREDAVKQIKATRMRLGLKA